MLGVSRQNVKPGETTQVISWENPTTSRAGQYDYTYCEDVHSRTVNIGLDRDLLPVFNPDGTENFNVSYEGIFWIVSWLAGNAGQKAEVDVQNGTFISVVGRNVNVQVSYPVIDYLPSPIVQAPVDVRAVLGFEGGQPNAGISSIARRTVRIGTIAGNGSSAIFAIPRFAVSAVIRNSDIATPTMTIEQLRNNQGGSFVNVSTIGKNEIGIVPICDGASFFRIDNNNPLPVADVSVVFSLGI
jgi:hypothetical protein